MVFIRFCITLLIKICYSGGVVFRGPTISSRDLNDELIGALLAMLDEHNPLVKNFRMARDRINSCNNEGISQEVRMRLVVNRARDGRTYNLPTTSEVAALIVGDLDSTSENRDIILQSRCGQLQRISELHPIYIPSQYIIMFVSAQDGFRLGILHSDRSMAFPKHSANPRNSLTMRQWFAFRLQDRSPDLEAPTILQCGKLFQQFCVDGYAMIESQRLTYIRFNQSKLRSENFKNISDAVDRGQTEASSSGSCYFIPSTFLGGQGYMRENYLDTMSVCKWYGFPDLFITFTCNPNWPEIKRFVNKRIRRPEDRPDIICRVFKLKLAELIKDLKEGQLFGRTQSGKILYYFKFLQLFMW